MRSIRELGFASNCEKRPIVPLGERAKAKISTKKSRKLIPKAGCAQLGQWLKANTSS
jgi:hypothetical protein